MADISELARRMGDKDPAKAHKAYRELEDTAMQASDPARNQRARVASQIVAELYARGKPTKDKDGNEKPGPILHSNDVRNKLLRLISHVAGAAEVAVLARAMTDLELREMARFALDRNTSPAATKALIKALDEEVGPEFRVGIVNALGYRGTGDAEKALRKATDDPNKPVRIAAAEALARYPHPANHAFIAKLTRSDCADCRRRAQKARVRLAEAICKAGKKQAAKKIYQAILDGRTPPAQKKAARIAIESMAS